MQNDPRGTPESRVIIITGGVVIFGAPVFYVLAGYMGVINAVIAAAIALAIAFFVAGRRYLERRRINSPSTNKPYRSTGSTRHLPQKYSRHARRSYNTAVNRPAKPEPSSLQGSLLKILRLALKPLRPVWRILNNRHEGDIRKDELVHRQTRHTPW